MQWSLFLLCLMGQCFMFICHPYVYHFVDEYKTWNEAQKYCREQYIDLATMSNMTDMKRLLSSTGNLVEAWIGLQSHPGKENRKWYWSLPGLEFNESQARWNPGEPNDNGKLENCALMFSQKWSDYPCYETHTFTCYNASNQFQNTFHFINSQLTWPQAQSYCREHYTDLVSGLDQLDDANVKTRSDVWIGLFRDTWRWSDGSNFSFRNWENVEDLVDGQSNKTCATVLNRAGKWSSDYCNNTKPFFCYGAPVSKHLVRLNLAAEDPSVNMNDPAVTESMLKQLEEKFRNQGLSVELRWMKLPEIQNDTKEAQREDGVCQH